jgi:undecaprenyl-diphosphatase
MWPGTSRSLVTILGGKWVGLSLKDSVIFSFLLGMVTLSASTLYDLLRNGEQMIDLLGVQSLVLGTLTAYFSAWIAVRGMVQYLKKHGLGLFGGYRIAIALVTAVLLLTGTLAS